MIRSYVLFITPSLPPPSPLSSSSLPVLLLLLLLLCRPCRLFQDSSRPGGEFQLFQIHPHFPGQSLRMLVNVQGSFPSIRYIIKVHFHDSDANIPVHPPGFGTIFQVRDGECSTFFQRHQGSSGLCSPVSRSLFWGSGSAGGPGGSRDCRSPLHDSHRAPRHKHTAGFNLHPV